MRIAGISRVPQPLGGLRALLEKSSFTAGEVSPTLYAAIDLRRNQTGLARCSNCITMYEGGLTRTPGTRFVTALKTESEASAPIPFRYSSGERNLLLINGGKMRVIRNGSVVLSAGPSSPPFELSVPWAAADLINLRPSQQANTITVACKGYAPQVIMRDSPSSWSLAAYRNKNGPLDPQNLDNTQTIQADATTGSVTLTAVGNPRFTAADVGTVWRLDEPDLSATPYWKASESSIAVGQQRRFQGNTYEVTVAGDAGPTAPTHEEGEWNAGTGDATWKFLHRGYGFVRITGFTDVMTVSGEVEGRLPDSVVANPTWRWWPPAWSADRGFPTNCFKWQQRLELQRDDKFWASKPAAPDDHESRIESDGSQSADSAIVGRLDSPSGSLVEQMWGAFGRVKIVGAVDSEWLVRGNNLNEAITAANQVADEVAHEGSAPHIPARVEGGAIYIGRGRKRLHFLKFDPLTEQLVPEELTATARHILEGEAAWLAWQRDPNRVMWIGCNDGALIGMTWMPKEQVVGFHRHPLAGAAVEWVCALGTSAEAFTEVYIQTRRIINGQTHRYIELLQPYFSVTREQADASGAWFLDCALSASFDHEVSTISGLDHLEGCTVGVFAGGVMRPSKVVASGAITLDAPLPANTEIVVGIAKAYSVLTLVLEPKEQPQRDQEKRANSVILHLLNSSGGKVRINGGDAEQLFPSGAADYGAPRKLFTGSLRVDVAVDEADENRDVQLEIFGDDAYPFTLLGITVPIELEGN